MRGRGERPAHHEPCAPLRAGGAGRRLAAFAGLFHLHGRPGSRCSSPVPTASAPRCCSGWSCRRHDVPGPRPGQSLGQRRAHDRCAAAVLPRLRRACTRSTTRSWRRWSPAWRRPVAKTAARCSAARPPSCRTCTRPAIIDLAGTRRGRGRADAASSTAVACTRVTGSGACRRPGCTPTATAGAPARRRPRPGARITGGLGQSLGEALLAPHPSYLHAMLPMLSRGEGDRAHHRWRHPRQPAARPARGRLGPSSNGAPGPCRRSSSVLQELGGIQRDEMLRVFNMGLGLIFVTDADLRRSGPRRFEVGRVVPRVAASASSSVEESRSPWSRARAPICRRCSTPARARPSRREVVLVGCNRADAPAIARAESAGRARLRRRPRRVPSPRRASAPAARGRAARRAELVVLAGFDES